MTLPGVGRKTANVILGNAFGIPGSPSTPTSAGSCGGGGGPEEDPVKVEHAVGELIERKEWTLLATG